MPGGNAGLFPETQVSVHDGSHMRRGARVAESGGLENRCTFTGTVGSNPTLSASFSIFETTSGKLLLGNSFGRGRLMVWHRVGSAAGRKACAGSSPALSASSDFKFYIWDLESGSGLRAIPNT